jgi:hypothetical protein
MKSTCGFSGKDTVKAYAVHICIQRCPLWAGRSPKVSIYIFIPKKYEFLTNTISLIWSKEVLIVPNSFQSTICSVRLQRLSYQV